MEKPAVLLSYEDAKGFWAPKVIPNVPKAAALDS